MPRARKTPVVSKSTLPNAPAVTSPGEPAPVTDQAAKPAKAKACKAADVGHSACDCGRDGCGDNVTT